MRTLLLVTALTVLLACSAPADTYVTDHITTDTTWTVSGSPYIVQGQIIISGMVTLTIDPGVIVEMDSGAELRTASDQGSIVAMGTEGNEILFTSHSGTPAAGDWLAVWLRFSPSSTFEHCTFEYGHYNLAADRCHPTVTNCTMSHGSSSGMYIEVGSPVITDCDFVYNDKGLWITGQHCYPSITGGNIRDNTTGIWLTGPYSSPEIHWANIYDNASYNMYIDGYTELPKVIINAENNWWGVDGEPEAQATINIPTIYEPYVEVDIDPWLHEVPVKATTWGRLKAMFVD